MFKQLENITLESHKDTGIKLATDFSQSKELTSAPITANEYYEACKHYPILFAKEANGTWFSLALLGVEKRNTFVEENGQWRKNCYIPAFVGRYPFLFLEQEGNLHLTFDTTQQIKKSDAEENYFFEEDGKHSAFLTKLVKALTQTQKFNLLTQDFIKTLDELGILEESGMNGKTAEGKDFSVGGFFIVKEEKLAKLTQKAQAKLCKKGYTQLLTAHMISISNIQKLVN